MEQETSYNVQASNNYAYNIASALQIRLDPTQILENIEMFLRGTKIIIERDAEGNTTTKSVSIGRAKANDLGIQSILNWVQMIINPQVVQGNFPSDKHGRSPFFDEYIYSSRINLSEAIIINCYNWHILDEDINVIIDSIMGLVDPFMTRLIDNKERDSYANTIRTSESNTLKEQGKRSINPFGNNPAQ